MARFAVGLSLKFPCEPIHFYSSRSRRLSIAWVISFISLFFAPRAIGQLDYDLNGGIPSFSTRFGGVDLSTGNVNLTIPVRYKTGSIPFDFAMSMNSHAFVSYGPAGKRNGGSAHWKTPIGFFSTPSVLGSSYATYTDVQTITCSGVTTDKKYLNWIVTDRHGTAHPLPTSYVSDDLGCFNPPNTAVTIDNSGVTLDNVAGVIRDNSGNSFVYGGASRHPASITDADGNSITYSAATANYTDTLGTVALTGTSNGFSYTDASGNTQNITTSTTSYYQWTAFGCYGISEINGTTLTPFVTSVSVPGGGVWKIAYEQTPGKSSSYTTGRISKITFPSGGSASYAYLQGTNSNGNNGIDCNSLVVPEITVTINDNAGNIGTWTYVNTNDNQGCLPGVSSCNFTVTETDPAGNQIVHSFAGEYETQAVYYQGTSTVLKTVTTCYNGIAFASCVNPSTVPSLPITEIDVYTSLGTSSPNRIKTTFDSYGNALSVLTYDFGAGTPMSQVFNVYGKSYSSPTACTAYPAGTYIYNTPCYTHIENSAGTDLARTKISYNNDSKPASISRWTGAVENTWLTTSFGYGASGAAAGVLSSTTDVNGAITSFSNFACNGMLPQTITLPTVNVAMSTAATYDCNGGVKLTDTDVNGNTATYSYTDNGADPLYRTKSVTHPDGGLSSYSYNTGSSLPWTTTVSTSIAASQPTITTTATLDGFGRTYYTQSSDPNSYTGYHQTQTIFNNLGQVVKRYNPYIVTTDPTFGFTAYTYDALGRILNSSAPTGMTEYYTYTNRAVLHTDFSGVQTASQLDGLGRMAYVCTGIGMTGTLPNGHTASACGLDVSTGNGFLETNSYDALGNLLSSAYSGQTRAFQYDGLSRTTSVSTPEVGSVYYAYDTATAGDLYTRTAPKENVQSGTVVTTYSFDALHRPLTISYNDSYTPTKYFYWDVQSWWSGAPTNYPKGRLARQNANTCGTQCAGELYLYNAMGQIENKASWGPTNIGSGVDSSYTYNYAGEIATETDIWGHNYTPTYNSIGQMTSLASSLSDSTHPSPLYSGISYNPLGEIASETFGNGIIRTNTYDADGRITNIADMNGSTQVYGLHVLYGANQISASHDTVNGYWSPYIYDTFGRLASSNCISTCPNGTNVEAYTYSYDEFGNRWSQAFTPGVSGNSGTTNSATYNSKNQLTPSGCAGGVFCYDAAGNLQMDSLGVTWTHDAEGKLTAWANSSITATYVYDALGQRMERSLTTGHTDAYASGVLAMTDATSGFASSWWESVGESIYANSSTYFPSRDNLHTPRLQTDPLGASNSTFYVNIAFGDEGNASHMWGWNFFAGMLLDDPDGDMGHDYVTPNRNYNPTEGRWMVPDPAGLAAVDLTNPQSWNRYAYVLNNPVSFIDPLGLDCVYLDDSGTGVEDHGIDHHSDQGECWANGGFWADGYIGGNSWVQTFANSDNVIIASSVNGFLGQTLAGSENGGGTAFSQMFSINTPVDTILSNIPNGYISRMSANNQPNIYYLQGKVFLTGLGRNFVDEFKQGGCVSVFGSATAGALNPFSPSLSSAGEGTAAVLAASKYNAAVQYAASAPNYLGGTGLIYPMKSSVVRGMIADANATAASGGLMSFDLALTQGFATEMYSMATGGCH